MSKRIAIASCREKDQFVVEDDPVLAAAFESRGHAASIIDWDDTEADWASMDALLIRTTWDIVDRMDEFVPWLEHVESVSTLINPLEVLRTNFDKGYLKTLAENDVPIVPSVFIEPDEFVEPSKVAAELEWDRVAVKPQLGAAAVGLLVGNHTDPRINEHAKQLSTAGPFVIQPFIENVTEVGEMSVVIINGEFSHAVRKTPAAGDIRVQCEYGGRYELAEPTPRAVEVARAAYACFPDSAMYARIDLLNPDGENPMVIESELVEPELFFRMTEAGTTRFVEAVLARLGG
ncbi:MAG: hypothetical protein AAGI17_05705 [Planctomycetota bacterium]